MFKVYWTQANTDADGKIFYTDHGQVFEDSEMSEALKFMENLRSNDPSASYITMCSENPNSVGKAGVAEVGPDYNWTKRRGNMPGLKK